MIGLFRAAAVAALSVVPVCATAATLTDSTVFSTNSEGNNWNGWIWNTQGQPADIPNRWNLYYSTAASPPAFINGGNDAGAQISIALDAGVYDFYIFGESATTDLHPEQHFVLNLYFNGNQSAPGISGLYGASCPVVCAASHPNGLDILGDAGAPEAGTLSFVDGTQTVTLTAFDWIVDGDVNEVWEHWAGPYFDYTPYGSPDFVGHVQLTVTDVATVPVPAGLPLLAGGLVLLGAMRRRRS